VHALYGDAEVRDAVAERFGAEVIGADGRVDRAAVARAAFAGDGREWLERLLWPRVGERVVSWRTEQDERDPRPRAAVVEVPLLFEAGMDAVFDATLAIVAEEALRAERAGGRGHASVAEREARQLSQADKARRATVAVRNDGDVADLERGLAAALDEIAARAA
jgi:dephospho-CoA kinase